MLNITNDMINKIAPGANQTIVSGLVPYLNQYLSQYDIDTLVRMKHFFGQAAEETAGFKTLTEYASGKEYEGRADLGNTQAGDGVKYKGRGIFQLTGRFNYTAMSKKLGVDLINNPELAATPKVAVQTACEYWNGHNLSAIADSNLSFSDTCTAITKKINGGTYGLSERLMYSTRAASILSSVTNTIPDVPVSANNNESVFPTPVIKPVEEPTPIVPISNTTTVVSNTSVFWSVKTLETYIKKFF